MKDFKHTTSISALALMLAVSPAVPTMSTNSSASQTLNDKNGSSQILISETENIDVDSNK